jgi:hypothetical protein
VEFATPWRELPRRDLGFHGMALCLNSLAIASTDGRYGPRKLPAAVLAGEPTAKSPPDPDRPEILSSPHPPEKRLKWLILKEKKYMEIVTKYPSNLLR